MWEWKREGVEREDGGRNKEREVERGRGKKGGRGELGGNERGGEKGGR